MLTIITPCCRPENLSKLYASIAFHLIDKWIIVYDTSHNRTYTKSFVGHPKILEVECDHVGVVGHPQRNYGMDLVTDGFIYFLDDDNIIHHNFWSIVEMLDPEYFYTFDQLRNRQTSWILPGHEIALMKIDTAMFLFHRCHVKTIRWQTDRYDADGRFICEILAENPGKHIYIKQIGCYYNYLSTEQDKTFGF
jgi:hypothetical protein